MLRMVESSEFNAEMLNTSDLSASNITSSLGILSEAAFLTRIIDVDYYQSFPRRGFDVCFSDFRGCEIYKVPVIRVFGITPAGQKTCLHVHGVFPYLSIKCEDNMPKNASDGIFRKYTQELALGIDKAINIAIRKSNSSQHHVYKIVMITGIPFYGYHEKEQPFLRIYFYNPNVISKAAELLAAGAVMNRVMQPYEAHISYILQFLIDYKLFGMNFIGLKKITFRMGNDVRIPVGSPAATRNGLKPSPNSSILAKIWCMDVVNSSEMSNNLKKQTTCELEADCISEDILNRLERKLPEGRNPGLLAIWEEERERRRLRGECSQLTPAASQERTNIVESESEIFYKEKLKRLLFQTPRNGHIGKGSKSLKGSQSEGSRSSIEDQSSQKSDVGNLSFSDSQDKEVLSAFLSMMNESNFNPDQDSILSTQPENLDEVQAEDEALTIEMSQQIFDSADDWQYSPLFGAGRAEEEHKLSDDDDLPMPDICIPQLDGTDDTILEQVPKQQPVPIPPQKYFNSNNNNRHQYTSGSSVPLKSISSNLSRKKNRLPVSEIILVTSPQSLTGCDILENISFSKIEQKCSGQMNCSLAGNLNHQKEPSATTSQPHPKQEANNVSKDEPIVIRPPFRKRKELFNLPLSPVNTHTDETSREGSVMQPKLTLKWRRKQLFSDNELNGVYSNDSSGKEADRFVDGASSSESSSNCIAACDGSSSLGHNHQEREEVGNETVTSENSPGNNLSQNSRSRKNERNQKQEKLGKAQESSAPSSPSLKMKFKFKKVKTRSKEARIYVVEKEFNESVGERHNHLEDLGAPKVKLKLADIPKMNLNTKESSDRLPPMVKENSKKKFTTSRKLMTRIKDHDPAYRCPLIEKSDSCDSGSSYSSSTTCKRSSGVSHRKKSKMDNSVPNARASEEHPADVQDKRLSKLNLVLMRNKNDGFHCVKPGVSDKSASLMGFPQHDKPSELVGKKKSRALSSGQPGSEDSHDPPKKAKCTNVAAAASPECNSRKPKAKYRLPKLHLKLTDSDSWTACGISEQEKGNVTEPLEKSSHTNGCGKKSKKKKKMPAIKIVLPRCSPTKNLHKSCSESFRDTELTEKEPPEAHVTETVEKVNGESCKPCFVKLSRISDDVLEKYQNHDSVDLEHYGGHKSDDGNCNEQKRSRHHGTVSVSSDSEFHNLDSPFESESCESECLSFANEAYQSAFSPDERDDRIDTMWNLSYFSPPRNAEWTLNSPPSCDSPNPDDTDLVKANFDSKSEGLYPLASRIKMENDDSLDKSSTSSIFDKMKSHIKDEFLVKNTLSCMMDKKCFTSDKPICSCHSLPDFKSFSFLSDESKEAHHKIWCSSYPGLDKSSANSYSKMSSLLTHASHDISNGIYKSCETGEYYDSKSKSCDSNLLPKIGDSHSPKPGSEDLKLQPRSRHSEFLFNHISFDSRCQQQTDCENIADYSPPALKTISNGVGSHSIPTPESNKVASNSLQSNVISSEEAHHEEYKNQPDVSSDDVPQKNVELRISEDSTCKNDSEDYFSVLPSTQLSLYSMLEDDDDTMQDAHSNLYQSPRDMFWDNEGGVGVFSDLSQSDPLEPHLPVCKTDPSGKEAAVISAVHQSIGSPAGSINQLANESTQNNHDDDQSKNLVQPLKSKEAHSWDTEANSKNDQESDSSKPPPLEASGKSVIKTNNNSNGVILSIDQILLRDNPSREEGQSSKELLEPPVLTAELEKPVSVQDKCLPVSPHLIYSPWRSQPVTTPASILAPKLTELLNSGPANLKPLPQNILSSGVHGRNIENNNVQEKNLLTTGETVQINLPFLPATAPTLSPQPLPTLNTFLPPQNQIVVLPEATNQIDSALKSPIIFPPPTGLVQLSPLNVLAPPQHSPVMPMNVPPSAINGSCVPVIESGVPVPVDSELGERFTMDQRQEVTSKQVASNDDGDILSKLVRSCDIDLEFDDGQDDEETGGDPMSTSTNTHDMSVLSSDPVENPGPESLNSDDRVRMRHSSCGGSSISYVELSGQETGFIHSDGAYNLTAIPVGGTTIAVPSSDVRVDRMYEDGRCSVGSSNPSIPSPLISAECSSERGPENLDGARYIAGQDIRSNENSFLLDSPGIHSFYGDESIYGLNSSVDFDAQNCSLWDSMYGDEYFSSNKRLDIRGSISSRQHSSPSTPKLRGSLANPSGQLSLSRKNRALQKQGKECEANSKHGKVTAGTNKAVKVLTPKLNPPTWKEVQASAHVYGLPEEKHTDAFYSNPRDSEVKQGELEFKAKTYSIPELPDFDSYLHSLKYSSRNESLYLKHFEPSGSFNFYNEVKRDPRMRVVLSGNRNVILSPGCVAPSVCDVKKWLRGPNKGKESVEMAQLTPKGNQVAHGESTGCEEKNVSSPVSIHNGNRLSILTSSLNASNPGVIIQSPDHPISSLNYARKNENFDHLAPKSNNPPKNSRLSKKKPNNIPQSSTPVHAKNFEQRASTLMESLLKIEAKEKCMMVARSTCLDKSLKNFKENCALSPVNHLNPSPTKRRKLEFGVGNDPVLLLQNTLIDTTANGTLSEKSMLNSLHNSSASQIDGPTLCNTGNFRFSCGNVEDVQGSHENQHLTVMSIEIHVNTRNELNPNPLYDPVTAVFFAVSRDDESKHSVGVIIVDETTNESLPSVSSSKISDLQKELLSTPGLSQNLVFCVKDEVGLFEELSSVTSHYDPDILVGYEIQKLSLGFLLQRAAHLNIDLRTKISRLLENESNNAAAKENQLEEDLGVDQSIDSLHIVGRIILNLWRLMRSEITLNVYTFENVYYHVLHKRTPLYAFHTLTKWYTDKCQLQRWRVFSYYVIRASGNLLLLDQLNIIGQTSEFARVFGIRFYDVLSRGSQYRVESMMLRVAKPLSYIPVSPTVQQRSRARAPECVPLIFEPESRFYVDPVLVLDFQSLYPSMMIAYNYCFSTCLGRVEHFGKSGPFDFGCTSLSVGTDLLLKLGSSVHISPTGIAFVKANIRKGILPMMLEEILSTRIMVKQSMKLCKTNKTLSRLLDARQLGLKLIANVTYGYTSANFSGRMSCVEVADSIVGKGRETLERAIHLIEESEEWNAKVVYGDTDSMFVLLPGRSKEQAFKIGQDIADAVTALNPKPVKLKFEKVYLPCILQTKKRYVGYMYETLDQKDPVFDAKGIETVRRDTCSAAAKILEKSLKVLFDTRDVSLVKKYVQKQFEKLLSGRVNAIDFIFAKEYRGRNGYRPGACVPALEIAKKRLLVDPRSEPCVGERVPYVVVYGFPGLPVIQLVREPLELFKDPSLRINAKYYVTRVIIPPLDRALSLIGVDVKNWYTNVSHMHVPSLPMVPTTSKPKGTLSQYFTALSCPACEQPTNYGLCSSCHQDAQGTAVVLNEKIRVWERKYNHLKKICGSCSKNNGCVESCISIDCPILFRLQQAQKDASQAPYLRNVLLHELF